MSNLGDIKMILLRNCVSGDDILGNRLPPTLFIQADNCFRENKNRFVFAFLQLLVERNIFKEIHLSFLYVGHTHEDVDQAFSVYSKKLRVTDSETLSDLQHLFGESVMLNNMYDIKSWIHTHIEDFVYMSKPLHFKFTKFSDSVKIQYKGQFSSDWIDLESDILKEVPTGKPDVLKPDYEKIDVELNLKQIESIKPYFKKCESVEVWKRFYGHLANAGEQDVSSEWILDTLPTQTEETEDEIVADIPDHVQKLLNKETEVPQVKLKRKKNLQTQKKSSQSKQTPQSKKGTKKKTGNKRGNSKVPRKTVALVLTDPNMKKHIWLMIFIDLLGYAMTLFTYLFLMLIMIKCVEEVINYLRYVWCIILQQHLGINPAAASVCTFA